VSHRWTNWTGDQVCAPAEVARPEAEEELIGVVRRAADADLPIRAAGAGHSFTDCACTEGVMIDTSGLQKILDVDPGRRQVTVQAGIRLHQLGRPLAKVGLALENQGDIDRQSISGAIATSTHGTGGRLRNLSAQIVGLRLITASGEAIEVSAESDRETYLAARVSLGALGVISAVTIQCVPLYTLHRHDAPEPLDQTLERLEAHVEEHDHFEFFVFPYTTTALTRRTQRSDRDPSPPSRFARVLQEELVENGALSAACRTGRRFPRLVPRLNRLVTAAMSETRVEDRAFNVYATHRAVRFTEMEYAIPRRHAAEVVQQVLRLVARRRLPILFPLEVRFSAPDEAFLSTAHGRDTCYVAVHQYSGMEFETYFRAVEEIMDTYEGRPHWGKRHYQTAATLAPRYPAWERFQAVRTRLDPDRRFANPYTRRVLG
jgi:L-gulono-1,4-lactone dehydrogenase